MNLRAQANSRYGHDAGAALLIAIFALLLISVVAIAMIVSTGTDSALAGNYRTASSAYYASVAGLEEARGRIFFKNPDFINKTGTYTNVLFDSSGTLPAWGLTNVVYIINPASGETVDPAAFNGPNPATYPDTEYGHEFSSGLGGANVQPYITSVSSINANSLPGPNYKWVRINPVTEQSLNVDVNGDGTYDRTVVVFYDPAHVDASNNPAPSLVLSTTPGSPPTPPTPTSVEVLEITALAVLPGGGTRLLQYLVAPLMISPDLNDSGFPAALTLDGNGVELDVPSSGTSFQIYGVDGCNPPSPPGVPNAVASIGFTNLPADYNTISTPTNANALSYKGAPLSTSPPPFTASTPSLWFLAPPSSAPGSPAPPPYTGSPLRPSWLTPSSLDGVVQDITNNADVIIQGPINGADLFSKAPGMSASNPMTVVVNGDFNFTRTISTGYGLLLVTGNMTFDPDANWVGIVMVVGQGSFAITKNGSGGFTGAFFVAKTRDASGTLLPNMGVATFSATSTNPGFGIAYNSCVIRFAQGPLTYKVLSFHEILTS